MLAAATRCRIPIMSEFDFCDIVWDNICFEAVSGDVTQVFGIVIIGENILLEVSVVVWLGLCRLRRDLLRLAKAYILCSDGCSFGLSLSEISDVRAYSESSLLTRFKGLWKAFVAGG